MADNKIYKSPINGSELHQGNDGFYYSDYDNTMYVVNSANQVISLKSPLDGSDLHQGNDGFFHSDYNNALYMVSNNGNIKPAIDPYSAGILTQNPNGTYQSKSTGRNFMYDSTKDAFIPLYVPDDTVEDAHIENGVLVGNETGRRFEIDPDGTILTPEELAFRKLQQQDKEHLEQMVQNGTIDQHLEEINNRMKEQKPLSVNELREIVNGDLPNDVNKLKEIKDQVSQSIPVTENTSIVTIQEFLNANNIKNESDFIGYLKGMGMDGRIAERFGMVNGTNFMSMLGQDTSAPISIIERSNGDKAIYVPTTQNSRVATTLEVLKDGNIRAINNEHSPTIVNGIRYGNVSIVDMNMGENGDLNLVETHHQVAPSIGLQPVGSKPRFEVTSSRRPMTITTKGEMKQEIGINKQTILDTAQDGVLKPIQEHEISNEKLQELRNMGFDEKYFTKPNIAGVNYDINGNETVFENENQMLALQTGGKMLTKTSMQGYVDALILASIVGFISGFGLWLIIALAK